MYMRGRSVSGRVKADTSPGGVELRKKPKDLSASESDDVGMGRVGVCMLLCYSQIQYSHMVE